MANRWDGVTALMRLADRVGPITEGGCWPWLGATTTSGYGVIRYEGRQEMAHRVAFKLAYGPIPEGLVLDHLCRTPGCVNPAHLEAVPQRENCRRGIKGVLTTRCPQGHEYTEENTRLIPNRYGGDGRSCRTCHRERERNRKRLARLSRMALRDEEMR